MRANVLLKIRAGDVKDVVRELWKTESIVESYMTFVSYDTVSVVAANDFSSVGSLVASVIQPTPGVEQPLTCLTVDI